MSAPKHIAAIFGGAVAGAEAAKQLVDRGIPVVVFDQNALPYGKIEDGLPKWHYKLRDREEERINQKLDHPLVSFVPKTRLGEALDFQDVVQNWGFSAVLLAIGAWKDRPLPVEGVDAYINKGLYYQNAFIYWYNHFHEPTFSGPQLETPDDALIIGGGLASLDVAKALMFQNVERALRSRGIEENLFSLDRSIAKVLKKRRLSLQDLGIKGCTLCYRRRVPDMPLSSHSVDTPEALRKAQKIREKILRNYQSKYLFKMLECHMPVDKIIENDHLVGLALQQTKIEDGKVVPIPEAYREIRTPLVVSSIGSIPEPIKGIPMQWQTYKIDRQNLCRVEGFRHVFALGNTVTGQGNIIESLKHSRDLTAKISSKHFEVERQFEDKVKAREYTTAETTKEIARAIQSFPTSDEPIYQNIMQKVEKLQMKAGYNNDYRTWIKRHLPLRLESLIAPH